ncbi:unnamed protein product [Sympodiomycopsis kandeliae]
MLSSMIHHPCEITVHLISEDIFIHPPAPNSELPGRDQTLRGVVEIKVPSERTIHGVKVALQGIQTIGVPENGTTATSVSGLRWEEKLVMDKTMEVLSDGEGGIIKQHKNRGKGKSKEKPKSYQAADQSTPRQSLDVEAPPATEKGADGIHLSKGVHGFEFAFIIPASSPPFERSKHGRVRYIVTATALGAGRARHNITAWREVFVILNVDKDGGPSPLEIIYADIHEALGPISLSLTAASLTVGGTAMLTVVHPDPPPKLSVHVIRVFIEQTTELYSETKKAWLKLPAEKMRVAEWGHMPNKPNRPVPPSQQPSQDPASAIWIGNENGHGKPGKGAFHAMPHVAPYGTAVPHMATASSAPATPGKLGSPTTFAQNEAFNADAAPAALPVPIAGTSQAGPSAPRASPSAAPGDASHAATGKPGYKLRTTVRLPNDDHMRPSTVRGSRADIRVSHEMGIEVFFSRKDVLDTRETSDSFGQPKVQVFSARRSVVVPSCTATFDTVHLPPYVEESPVNSRPPSPTNLARSPSTVRNANHSHPDLQKLANTLHNTLPGGRRRPTPPHSKTASHPNSNPNSVPGSRHGSRDPSPTRNGFSERDGHPSREVPSRQHSYGSSIGHSLSVAFGSHFPTGMGIGRKSRPNSRPASRPGSPTLERSQGEGGLGSGHNGNGSAGPSGGHGPSSSATGGVPIHHPRSRRGLGGGLQGFTPATATQTVTAPPSGAATPIHGGSSPHGSTTPQYAYSPQTHSLTSGMMGMNLGHIPSTPRTLPANSPWGVSSFPHRTGSSHNTCNCGRTTEELSNAELRLLEGVPTAPGAFSEHHAEGEMPPPWTESRPPSPDYFSQVWAGTQSAVNTPGVGLTMGNGGASTKLANG